MSRRRFLVSSLYASIGLVFAGCGKAKESDHAMHGKSNESSADSHSAYKEFDLNTLLSNENFRAPLPLLLTQEGGAKLATLAIQEKQVQLSSEAKSNLWLYQDQSGGSMMDVMEGDAVRIKVQNHLPEATTVHWHGIAVPSSEDGHPHDLIAPHGSREYAFTVPADSAGTYWYHPHPHQRTAIQAGRGLAAPFIVRSHNDPLAKLGIADHVLLLSALQLDGNAQISEQNMMEQMNGREGNALFVNGQYQPTLNVAPNSTHRLRLINASNARYMRLSLDAGLMTIVGVDGGLLAQALPPQKELLLAPAERVEVLVTFNAATSKVILNALPYDKGWMDGDMGWEKPAAQTIAVMQFKVVGDAVKTPVIPKQLRVIKPLGEASVTRKMVLSEKMEMSMAGGKHSMTMEFMINNQMFDMNRVDFKAKQNVVELWEIVNDTDMDHPFHIHGDHFQVVSVEESGKVTPASYLAWKDTVNAKAGQTVRIKIMQKQTGLRMFHCHILEHEDLGMMGQYEVLA